MLKVLVFVAILVGLSTADVLYSNLNNLYLKIVSPSAGSFFAIRLDTTTYASGIFTNIRFPYSSVLDRLDTDGFNKLQLTYSLSIPQSQTDYTLTINPTTKNAILVATDDAFDNNNFYIGEYNSVKIRKSSYFSDIRRQVLSDPECWGRHLDTTAVLLSLSKTLISFSLTIYRYHDQSFSSNKRSRQTT